MINVTYQLAKTPYKTMEFLREISEYPLISCDFETAIKYSPKQILDWKQQLLSPELTKLEKVAINSKLTATALDHPSHVRLTHFSLAISNSEAYVFVINDPIVQHLILNYINTTEQKQVWHNASYDFQISNFLTGKFPKNYEDTALLAKCLLNHVNVTKSLVGLKHLAGHMYGDWGLSSDNFSIEHMYDPKMLKYAAIDACAVYYLFNYINSQCDLIDMEIENEFNSNDSSFN